MGPGSRNLGDYHTKHHQVVHHQSVCDIYLHRKANKIQDQGIQRWCVDSEGPQTEHVAALITEALKRIGFQTRILHVNMRGNASKYVPLIST